MENGRCNESFKETAPRGPWLWPQRDNSWFSVEASNSPRTTFLRDAGPPLGARLHCLGALSQGPKVHSNCTLTTFPSWMFPYYLINTKKAFSFLFFFFAFPAMQATFSFQLSLLQRRNFINQTKCVSFEHSTCIILAIRLSMGQKGIHFQIKYFLV